MFQQIAFLLIAVLQTGLSAEITLTAEQLKAGIDSGLFNALIDVRSANEFNGGHIEGAYLVDSLASFGTSFQVATPSDLAGCESCDIAVYCQSGNRAGQAIKILEANGFVGKLYNGQGILQWQSANYEIVTTGSVEPSCLEDFPGQQECQEKISETPSGMPSSIPSTAPLLKASTAPSFNGGVPPKKTLPGDTSKDDSAKLFQSEFDIGRGSLTRRRTELRGKSASS